MKTWHPHEGGGSIGRFGPAEGVIIQDEEYGAEEPDQEEAEADARLTLERDTPESRYAVTATVYGWMAHTQAVGDEEKARETYSRMKPELEQLVSGIPYEDDDDIEGKAAAMAAAVARFEQQFA